MLRLKAAGLQKLGIFICVMIVLVAMTRVEFSRFTPRSLYLNAMAREIAELIARSDREALLRYPPLSGKPYAVRDLLAVSDDLANGYSVYTKPESLNSSTGEVEWIYYSNIVSGRSTAIIRWNIDDETRPVVCGIEGLLPYDTSLNGAGVFLKFGETGSVQPSE